MNKNRRKILILLLALAAYGLLLGLLVWAESGQSGDPIDSLPEALWYSLVTLSTVGYGDLYPRTPVGRLVGIVLLLMSTGLLALVIGAVAASLTNRLLPGLRLWFNRRRRWYVFSTGNSASRALAGHLDDGFVVYCRSEGSRQLADGLALWEDPGTLFARPVAHAGERLFFAMDADALANEADALALQERSCRIFCRSEVPGEGLPENITPFNEFECCARLYWQTRPWIVSGERVALLGNGRYARALLEQGLLTAPPGCAMDLFGDWSDWQALHQALAGIPEPAVELRFHRREWYAHGDLLRCADRVIIGGADEHVNLDALHRLKLYCPIRGAVDVRGPRGLQEAFYFGQDEALFTPELVMKQSLNGLARQMHELYRAQADASVPAWEALSDFTKRSNLAAADHLLTKARWLLPQADIRELTPGVCARAVDRFNALGSADRERCRRIEHNRWMLFHGLHGWRHAPLRNNAAREHPMMVPYEALDEAEHLKDDNAWLLLGALAKENKL